MISTPLNLARRCCSFSTFKPQKYTGLPFEQVKQHHKKYMMPFLKPYYTEPFLAVQGKGQYLYDDKGDQYLDLVGGISCVSVGHSHPRLNKIFAEQAQKLLHISCVYCNQYEGQYAKALCESLGQGFQVAYLCNSGSQANDFAHLLARLYTKSEQIYTIRQSYHGIAGNAYSLSSMKNWNSSMPKYSQTQKLQWPNFYRKPNLTVDHLVEDAQEQMSASSNGQIAGFWAEPIMGAAGIVELPSEYCQKMQKLVKKYNGLYISDEVQTGFGRVGTDFWGFKNKGVKPDIVVTAKSMANGYPMGAVITSKKIMSAFTHNYFNTYGGGVLQSRLGLQVLNIIKEQKLDENAQKTGNYLKEELLKLQKKSKVIGDVRGKGMMIGIQFVEDQESKVRAPHIAAQIMEDLKKERILIAKCAQQGNVLRVTGTLCLTMDNIKKTVQVLEHAVKKYE